MPIILAEISPIVPPVVRELQQIGRGSNVLVTVRATLPMQAEQRYWLCQPDHGVPVEVSILADTGEFSGITTFLLDVVHPGATPIVFPPAVAGYPRFDLGPWDQRKSHFLEHGRPTGVLTRGNLIIGFFGFGAYAQRIDAGSVQFLVGADSALMGVVVPRLDAASLRLLEVSGVLDVVHLRQGDLQLPDIETEIEDNAASTITVSAFFNSRR